MRWKYLKIFSLLITAICFWSGNIAFASPSVEKNNYQNPRLIVLTDIGNEPDDQMSFIRLLIYANQLDIEALVATTSTWQRNTTNPQTLLKIIDTYEEVQPNLLLHAEGWPSAETLRAKVFVGQHNYGMGAVGEGKSTAGSNAIIAAVDKDDARPVWISLWGGANTLAQALLDVRATRSAEALQKFVSKIKVYAISDQDDAGLWIRREFPELFYIVQPSSQDGSEYIYATWTGISGDFFFKNCQGANPELITNTWLDKHIRSKGLLGKLYPRVEYIMEGDTPAFFHLLNNGLASDKNPSWGGWGGRYIYRQPRGETRAIWTQGGNGGGVTSRDQVFGMDGELVVSDQASIWRWREAFQQDFAARMDWTIKSFDQANHNPQVVVNNLEGTQPIELKLRLGQTLELDASATSDPDNNALSYEWMVYPEAGFEPDVYQADLLLENSRAAKVKVTALNKCRKEWKGNQPDCKSGVAHIILSVTDNGKPALTSYRRVIINVE